MGEKREGGRSEGGEVMARVWVIVEGGGYEGVWIEGDIERGGEGEGECKGYDVREEGKENHVFLVCLFWCGFPPLPP